MDILDRQFSKLPNSNSKAVDINGKEFEVKGRITLAVLWVSLIAGMFGITLGLDNGLTGGVQDMDAFL